jgi:hypothetical protein
MNRHVNDTVHDAKQQLTGLIILMAQDNRGVGGVDDAAQLGREGQELR